MITELHCHTTASDGLCSPVEVVRLAHRCGVELLAITDHDTLAANGAAIAAGTSLGISVIPGIEISAWSNHGEVHVLGYGVRPSDPATQATLDALRNVREDRARRILHKLAQMGIRIPFEQVKRLAGDGIIGRPHIARALVRVGAVQSEQEAFERYLAAGKPAFVPHEGLTPVEAVQLIHAAHGVAVLAHPGLYRGDLNALLAEMMAAGLDGLEVFYPLHTAEHTRLYADIARRNDLLMTGGSDFHGSPPPSARDDGADDGTPSPGTTWPGSVQVPDAALAALQARLRMRGKSSASAPSGRPAD